MSPKIELEFPPDCMLDAVDVAAVLQVPRRAVMKHLAGTAFIPDAQYRGKPLWCARTVEMLRAAVAEGRAP